MKTERNGDTMTVTLRCLECKNAFSMTMGYDEYIAWRHGNIMPDLSRETVNLEYASDNFEQLADNGLCVDCHEKVRI